MKKTFALLTLLLAFLPSVLLAQTNQVKMIFADVWEEVQVTDAKGNPIVADEGVVVPVGATIKTAGSGVELQLTQNKTIIRLSTKTTFKISALQGASSPSNDFQLATGKIRAVAAKITGATKDPAYNISTPTANCGVRGTDFAMKFDAEEQMDWVCVQEGAVDFANLATGALVSVTTGQFANTFDAVFAAAPVSPERLAELFSDVDFVKLDPKEVPGKEVASTTQEAAAETTEPAPEAEKPQAAPDDPMMAALKKLVGLEVGSITISGVTYSKAVMSPVVAFDGFKLGLYLPIIYTSDMFNPSDWYRPEGNDEWSFGTDHEGIWDKTADIAKDIALKIKYLEIGVQGADPFYLKLGNLKTMTIGHGTVVRNFANDQDFPSVRKIGLNAGLKLGPLTVEGMADNVAEASVVAGRLAMDLLGDQVSLGLQTAADLRLANDQDLAQDARFFGASASDFGKPVLLVGGLDLQLFKVNAGILRMTAFADANTLALYVPDAPTIYGMKKGLDLTPLYHDGKLGSFGGETGVYGNLVMVDYRLSFQVEKGLYTNGIFQGNYYRTRNTQLESVAKYVIDSDERNKIDENLNMGVFGSFGFDIGLFSLEGAYRWPFEIKADGGIGPSKADSFKVRVDIPKDKIPFVALSGGVSYERTGFVPSLQEGTNLFDANTVFKGEVVYGLAKGMDLVIGIGTATMRAENGDIIFDGGKPKVGPTVSIDTKVSL